MSTQCKPISNDPFSSSSSQPSTSRSEEKEKSVKQTYKSIAPFPNRLTNTKMIANESSESYRLALG